MLVGAGCSPGPCATLSTRTSGSRRTTVMYCISTPPEQATSRKPCPRCTRRLEQEFGALPGVQSVGLALYSTLEGNNWGESVYVEGRPDPGPNAHNGSSVGPRKPQFFPDGRPAGYSGTRVQRCRHRHLAARRSRESGVREEVLSQRRSHRAALWYFRPEVFRRIRDCGRGGRREVHQSAPGIEAHVLPAVGSAVGGERTKCGHGGGRSLFINSITLHFSTRRKTLMPWCGTPWLHRPEPDR